MYLLPLKCWWMLETIQLFICRSADKAQPARELEYLPDGAGACCSQDGVCSSLTQSLASSPSHDSYSWAPRLLIPALSAQGKAESCRPTNLSAVAAVAMSVLSSPQCRGLGTVTDYGDPNYVT